MNYRTLIKEVSILRPGEITYINSIGLSIRGIDTLRIMVKNRVLIPEIEEVKKVYKDIDGVMSGAVIFPQMIYRKGGKDYQKYMEGGEDENIYH